MGLVKESKRIKSTVVRDGEFFDVSLEIKDPGQGDASQYKCNVRNKYGEINANLNLNIELAPEIKSPPKVVKLEMHKACEIECFVKADSLPQFEWVREDKSEKIEHKITEDKQHKVKIEQTTKGEYRVSLEVSQFEKEEMGKYKLVAKNEKGVAKSKEVNVEETSGKAPTLTKKLKSLNIEATKAIEISCEIQTADINASVEWTKDGKKIQQAEEIEITFDGKVAALHIKEAKVEHAGDYMCVVKNQFGEAITKASVLVREKEKKIVKKKEEKKKEVKEEEEREIEIRE